MACTYPPESTGIRGSAASPLATTSTPCCSAHQCVATANEVKLANVALATSAPPYRSGSPNSSRNQRSAIVSVSAASGEEAWKPAFWSSSDAVQSAASAAGVAPPITKWKNRGPAEWVAAAVPTRSSRCSVATEPSPCSGNPPPSARSDRSASSGSAAGSYTGRSASESRYGPAAA